MSIEQPDCCRRKMIANIKQNIILNDNNSRFSNGIEWWRLRSELQKEISAPKNVRCFLLEVDEVSKEFLDYLPKSDEFDMLPKLTRLNLECKYSLYLN